MAAINKDSLKAETSTEFVTGQFDFTSHKDFVEVDSQYVNKEVYLHKKAYQAFKAMADSALKEGIAFTIISGARNFNYQKAIWDRKWAASDSATGLGKAKGILEYSSMPMTSRHHWGTEIDLNDLNNSYFESGQGLKEYEWLKEHANDFGFYQPYTDKSKNDRTGYNEEKWHWTYLQLASQYLAHYNNHVTNADITGFQGSELAPKIDMVKNYVNGISTKIKERSN
ncbi:M15 family metallopeptidase [Fodinibius salsisoli]|uniref:M15 family metallopeptidase n=1 Tax=Fodinibius salsisoli TaxID=2820877 RepID=A0ABT3PKL6_9BACT|nr:M15 family metallopeptidase [Fodinibius salsisoli]